MPSSLHVSIHASGPKGAGYEQLVLDNGSASIHIGEYPETISVVLDRAALFALKYACEYGIAELDNSRGANCKECGRPLPEKHPPTVNTCAACETEGAASEGPDAGAASEGPDVDAEVDKRNTRRPRPTLGGHPSWCRIPGCMIDHDKVPGS